MEGKWRLNLVYAVLALGLAALGVRLALLVHRYRDEGLRLSERQQEMTVPLPGRTGSIFCRSGQRYVLFAGSQQVPSCYVDPFILQDQEIGELSIALGEILQMDPPEVTRLILERRSRRFAWIKRQITTDQEKQIRSLRNSAVGISYEWRREYPNGQLASAVVGYVQKNQTPAAGVEMFYRTLLAGRDGAQVVLADAYRRPIYPKPSESVAPQDGYHLYLTIDSTIQGFLEKAVAASVEKFSAKWGAGIVLDPNTGEILALSSIPTYDPNAYAQATPAQRNNHCVTGPYEPGSIFKPIIAAAAVDAGLATWETKIDCEGGVWAAPRGGRISDHGASYGLLTVAEVIVHSSNIGMGKIGLMMGNRQLYETVKRFGFGDKTRVELPGESGGIVRAQRRWDTYSTPRVPFGQEISATVIQLAMAYASLCNGGELLMPRLVDKVTDAAGDVAYRGQKVVVRRTIAPRVSKACTRVMQDVVDGEGGTGKLARSKLYTIFGKTGTAQVAINGRYVDRAFTGSFVGGAPVDNPRLLCLISIHWPDKSKGHYGGTVAAPYVKDVLEQSLIYLNVPPDKHEDLMSAARQLRSSGRSTSRD